MNVGGGDVVGMTINMSEPQGEVVGGWSCC